MTRAKVSPRTLTEHLSLFSKSAALGYGAALKNSAWFYRRGIRVVTKDLYKAAALYRQCIFHRDNHDKALTALREIQGEDEYAAAPYGDWEPCWLMHQFVADDMKLVMMTLLLCHQRGGCVASFLPNHLIFDICYWVCTLPRLAKK